MPDFTSYEQVAALPRSRKLGVSTAIAGWELSQKLLSELATDEDCPLISETDSSPPQDVAKGVTLAVYASLLFDIWHRNWFKLNQNELSYCMDEFTSILINNWMKIGVDELMSSLDGLEQLYREENSNYLLRLGRLMCPNVDDISVIMCSVIQLSGHTIHTQPPVLDQISRKSDEELSEFIVEYFTGMDGSSESSRNS